MSEMPVETQRMLGMDADEETWAKDFYDAIQQMSAGTDRSEQARRFKVGVSDLGFCSERVRRMLLQMTPDDPDYLLAWIGTALGDHAEQAIMAKYPHMIRQAEVTLRLEIDGHVYEIPGHPDLIDPENGILWDCKTDFGLDVVERTGPSDQQQYQRHSYARAAHEAGLFPNHTLEELRVGNFWIDRGGVDKRLHVQMEPFDQEWVDRASEWLSEVIYAYLETSQGREAVARKEPPREVCAVVCGFYAECRLFDTDVEGLLTDPTTLQAIDMYNEGLDATRMGDRLKKVAKEHLRDIQGSTGTHLLRWVWQNPSEVPASTRRGYWKIDLKPIKRKK